MKRPGFLLAVVVLLVFSSSLFAQTNADEQQGLKPYDSWHGGDLDSVSLTSGGLMVHVPLVSFPQRGALNLSFSLMYNSKQWAPVTKCDNTGQNCNTKWVPMPRGGVLPFNATFGYVTGAMVLSSVDYWLQSSATPDSFTGTISESRSFISPDGSIHQMATSYSLLFPMRSLDASGLLQPDNNTLVLPNGVRFTYGNSAATEPGFQPSAVTDPNGNQITINSSGWTDTLGRLIPGSGNSSVPAQAGILTTDLSTCPSGTVSARNWDVPSVAPVNGGSTGTRRFKLCYSNFTIATNFGVQGIIEYGPTTTALLSAVVLPDGTMWTLNYDSYGNLTRLGFPTGGSISYTYNRGGFNCGGGGGSLWVASRTVDANDGTGGHTWTYSYSGQASSLQTTVTSPAPDSNSAVHISTNRINGVSTSCSLYETEARYYQGAAVGTPLKTVDTQYSEITDPGSGAATSVVPTQATVTWSDGRSSRVVNTYDSGTTFTESDINGSPLTYSVVLGSVLQKDEYDFSGGLIRSTFNHYKWQDDANYKNSNLLNLPVYSMVKNSAGCELAKTSSGYDETYLGTAVQGSGVTEQHVAPPGPVRGNQTSTSRWLISACAEQSAITSHTIPYDTGLPYQSYDPLNHMTQYTYSSSFYGAYLTQTNMPDTQMPDSGAPVVHHIISGNYDFNTGLLTSFTDENGQVFTYKYDDMLRLTQGNHPDQGETVFTYPDPNTVTRQRLISAGVWEEPFTAKFDGIGRTYQTLQATPSGTVEVDTTYDSVGRVSTVSNPYYQGHTTDPTYGIITNSYDGLSRVIQTKKQDGSISQVQYNQASGDGDVNVDCTIATDEAGKKREVCSDGLGRMVKVLEPNPASQATNATGWIAISGTEQTANSQPATSGQASITISGAENSTDICAGSRCSTKWDTGTVTITVNGYPESISYGQSDTPATVAWKLSCAFYNDTAAPAGSSCPASAGTSTAVALTARATGTASNYPFTTSSATSQGALFTGPSFSASPVSGTFTGGRDASSTPDSGQITATINGTNYPVNFGAADSPTSIALNLANAISAGSWANATASGGTVTLTSKTPGTVGDYSLSASYTWNTTQFSSPSFTTSTSGSSLTGALDANALNNQPYITVYQYDALNNMVRVDQKGSAPGDSTQWRTRTFTYDSLSRLITAHNPENGTMCYGVWSAGNCINGYDADGNLLAKTDGRNITVTYAYDALNRLTDETYNDGVTPKASYRYDYSTFLGQTFAYPIGREVATMVAGSTPEAFTSYDQMGRVKQSTQCNPGVTGCEAFTSGYDLLGDMTSLAYPSGLSVTYQYDQAARLYSASDSAGWTYASLTSTSQAYMLPSGAMGEMDTPNFKYTNSFNNRLQPTEIAAKMTSGTVLFDKTYGYNPPSTSLMNNGNIYTVTNLKDSTRTQTFTYDLLNRLATAQDAAHWSNVYTYDAWGNLSKKLYGPVAAGEHMDTSADTGNHLLGYSYDAGGNMTSDGLNTYVYDGENRISSVAGVTYTYDADGRRVKKSSGTNYWYGPSGEALAETDSAGTWTNYVFFGGIRLARNVNGDIKYYITDHLHSTAVFADKSGTVLDDNDFYPWGGVVPGVGQTTSNNTIKFTGKYRDTESGLDYFGARYYANVMGRFMSPDWAAKPVTVPYAEFGDPQSLNLYAYARNTPIVRIDSDGHFNDPFGTFDTFAGAGSDFSNMSGSWFAPAGDNTNSSQQNQQQQQPQQQQQQQPQQQQQQPQQQPQNQQPASQPAPTGPDGKPTPPPVPVPGAPDLPWKWNPNPQNPRGGTWGPDGWKGPNPPNGSWDPAGHWDINGGKGEPVDHYDPKGNRITPGEAHPGNAPTTQTMNAVRTAAKVGFWGTVAAIGVHVMRALGPVLEEVP